MTTEGWLRDLVLRAIVESPLSPWDAAFLKMLLEGRLARGGHFRRQGEKDGIAGSLDWAFLSVLLNLAGDPECVTLGSIAAGVRIGVAIRLPRARGILERKIKLRREVKPEDERSTPGCREELVFQDDYQSALESMAGVRGCADRARVGEDSEWDPERSDGGVWSRSTVWFSWSFLQGSAR